MQYAEKIADLRRGLTEVRISLRNAQTAIAPARAKAEARIVAAAGDEKALGANEKARDRALAVGLEADAEYQTAREAVRALEDAAMRIEADLESLIDARREAEWLIRDRLATALTGRDSPDERHHEEDGAWDAATDSALEQRLAAAPLAVELPPVNPNDRLFALDEIPF